MSDRECRCEECGGVYLLAGGLEPSRYCNECVHEVAERLEAALAASEAKLKALEGQIAQTKQAICAYCHRVMERDPDAILEHMQLCPNHPVRPLLRRAEATERDLAVLRSAIQGERQHTDEAEDRARVLEAALVRIEDWIGPRGALPVTNHAMAHDVQVFREMVCAALSATPAALRAVERAGEIT